MTRFLLPNDKLYEPRTEQDCPRQQKKERKSWGLIALEFIGKERRKDVDVVLNDRLGKKVRVKCNKDDTIEDLKKLVATQVGTKADKIQLQKWCTIYKDHITLKDYEIHDGTSLELYYN